MEAIAEVRRRSDVDFHDVFGGPPRRHSLHDSRRNGPDSPNLSHTFDSASLEEKPVFGEELGSISAARRAHHLGDDFFDDIFHGGRGGDASSTPPRKPDRRGSFSSSPCGSRIMSPVSRSIVQRFEPLVIGGSLPAQLSLSTRISEEMDVIASHGNDVAIAELFNPPPTSSTSIPVVASQTFPIQEDQKLTSRSSYRRSPLSLDYAFSSDRSSKAINSSRFSMESSSQKHLSSFDGESRSNHFSFYKWAGKGAILVMPSELKERTNSGSKRRVLPEIVVQGYDMPYKDENILTMNCSGDITGNHDNRPVNEPTVDAKKDIKTSSSDFAGDFECEVLPTDGFVSHSGSVPIKDSQIARMMNLSHLLATDFDGEDIGNKDVNIQGIGKEESFTVETNLRASSNVKKLVETVSRVDTVDPSNRIQSSSVYKEGNIRVKRVKGKVKQFIKIFSHHTSTRAKGANGPQNQNLGGQIERKEEVEHLEKEDVYKMGEEKEMSQNKNRVSTEDPVQIIQVGTDISSITDVKLFSEAVPASLDDAVRSPVSTQDLENFLVEQLFEVEVEMLKMEKQQDEIQTSDAKIREWAKGKEGNIRSLLSTLQYVLWPQSGWKPIALVDIIESASVKRAYQKALLYLHPDKLQQKGAAAHQKYIAGKVFDMLQEAWDHLNSVSPI